MDCIFNFYFGIYIINFRKSLLFKLIKLLNKSNNLTMFFFLQMMFLYII
ncbi:Uncharacterised protein [Mycobacterium tuberculosis]|nr:Uncharacterised protein [Mycobacterium tuberculosis]